MVSFFVELNYAPFKLLIDFENFTLLRCTPLVPPITSSLLTLVNRLSRMEYSRFSGSSSFTVRYLVIF